MSTFQSTSAVTKICHIHKLPIELLAAIFDEHSLQDWTAPFIDSSVCRRWRETTLLYPILWSRIIISWNKKRLSSIIKASLSRARENPLFVNFKHVQFTPEQRAVFSNMLFSDDVAPRIQVLCYEGYLTTLPAIVWRNLRVLHLKSWSFGEISIPFDRPHFPSLNELILNSVTGFPVLGDLPPLRYLLLSGVQDSSWILLISHCSDTLVELIVHNCLPSAGCAPARAGQPPFPLPIHLPQLRYLALFDSHPYYDDWYSLRSRLVAPNLSVIHEQPNHCAPFHLNLKFPSVIEYACRTEFLSLDENVFAKRLVLKRMALMGPLDRLRHIFRLMGMYPHRLSHLSAVELITPDGVPITNSQWLELLELLTGTPLYTTLKLQPMPRVSSVLRPFFDSAWKGPAWVPDTCDH